MKIKTITPEQCATHRLGGKNAVPDFIIDFVPVVKQSVGIGWIETGPATAADFKKYRVLLRPWLNPKKF